MSLLPGDENINHLYKYFRVNEYLIDSLTKNYLYFSFPYTYNDPFDCYITSVFEGTDDDFKKWYQTFNLPTDKFDLTFKEFKKNPKKYNKFNKQDFKSILICCLTEKKDNILMWSHYADSHKGICLEYNTIIEGNSLGLLFNKTHIKPILSTDTGFLPTIKINYDTILPEKYNILKEKNNPSKLVPFIKTKYKDWEYETERRIIVPPEISNSQKLLLNEDTLFGIIFGLNTEIKNIKKIYEIVKNNYDLKNINFYKSIMSDSEYKIIIDNIYNIEDYIINISQGR